MDNNQFSTAETVRSRHHLVLLLTVLVLTVFVAGTFLYLNGTWMQTVNPTLITPDTHEPEPFVYSYLPGAEDIISIPDSGDTTSYDLDAYNKAVTARDGAVDATIPSPLEFMYQGKTFAAYLESDEVTADEFASFAEELRALTQFLNTANNRPTFTERQPDILPSDLPPITVTDAAAVAGTYPFWPAIEAQLVTAYLINLDPANEAQYQEQVRDYFERLIASGYLGQSDLDASNQVYYQYIALASLYYDNPPEETIASSTVTTQ